MPHFSVARLIERSSTPCFNLLSTSLRRDRRLDEIGVLLDVFQHARNVFFQAEEIALFGIPRQRPAADGGFVFVSLGLGFGDEFLLPFVVPAFVAAEINVVVGQQLCGRFPARPILCRRLGGADEIIVA